MLAATGNEYDGFIYIGSDAIKNDVRIKETGMADKLIITQFEPATGEWVAL